MRNIIIVLDECILNEEEDLVYLFNWIKWFIVGFENGSIYCLFFNLRSEELLLLLVNYVSMGL